jgi:hypothetical protein
MMDTRDAIANKFRSEHESSTVALGEEKANVFPYFIGVFDTVAALGHRGLAEPVVAATILSPFVLSYTISFFKYVPQFPFLGSHFSELTFWRVFSITAPLMIATAMIIFLTIT